ncbi:hypothetical protein [Bartonella jaculi]
MLRVMMCGEVCGCGGVAWRGGWGHGVGLCGKVRRVEGGKGEVWVEVAS